MGTIMANNVFTNRSAIQKSDVLSLLTAVAVTKYRYWNFVLTVAVDFFAIFT